jgi:hypothetical protein
MAQTGFTPIQIYYSTTSSNLPLAANLTNGELAINSADGKLFYKDSGGTVQTIAWKTTPVSAGGTGATSASITAFNNITGYTASGATGTTSTNLVFSTSPSLTTPTLGVATATSINKMAITAPATSSTLAIADGKTLTANKTLTLDGTDSTTQTFPTTSATIARTDAAQTFTGAQTFSSQPILSSLTASSAVATDASKGLVSVTNTGTGNNVLATSPTFSGTEFHGGGDVTEFYNKQQSTVGNAVKINITFTSQNAAQVGHFIEINFAASNAGSATRYAAVVRYALNTTTSINTTLMATDLVGVTQSNSVSGMVFTSTLTLAGAVIPDYVMVTAKVVTSQSVAVVTGMTVT